MRKLAQMMGNFRKRIVAPAGLKNLFLRRNPGTELRISGTG